MNLDCWNCRALSSHESDIGRLCDCCFLIWEEEDEPRELRRWAKATFGFSHVDAPLSGIRKWKEFLND